MARGLLVATVLSLAASVALVSPVSPAAAVAASDTAADPAHATAAALGDPAHRPTRGFFGVKGLQPDFWPDPVTLAPGLGTVSMNLFWPDWEPTPATPPCDGARPIGFDGRCFTVPPAVDDQIRTYTALGVSVTAIVYGTPAWARGARPCEPAAPGFEVFCVPDDPGAFARFAGMLADRYNGARGDGRIAEFVIQNEVNANTWFDTGCGNGTPCDLDAWIADYAALYDAAYDHIRVAQPHAPVRFSFEHHFGAALDAPGGDHPIRAVELFLPRLAALVGDREWSVAMHPYPRHLFVPTFDARDYPYLTMGNVGIIVGWLRARYPDRPHAWDVALTEVGFHNSGALDDRQRDALCASFRNVTATPGITTFIYHRMRDHPDEGGLALGLRRADGSAKPAWDTWRHATDADARSCGFERYPNTVIAQGVSPFNGARWYSSRDLPRGYVEQAEHWLLSYDPAPGTAPLFECGRDAATYLWRDAGCRGDPPRGPVGYLPVEGGDRRTALLACSGATATTVTTATACPAGTSAELLGYVPSPAATGAAPTTAGSPGAPDRATSTGSADVATPVTGTPAFAG